MSNKLGAIHPKQHRCGDYIRSRCSRAAIGEITNGGITNDLRPVISVTAADDITLARIHDGTTLLGEVTVSGGTWSFTPDSDLANGSHSFRIKAVDAAGNEGAYSTTWRINIDTLAPNAPSITSVYDDVGSVQGNIADGKSTDDLRPTIFGGVAEAGSTVKVYDNGVLLGETKANTNGTWSFTPETDLATGAHSFTVTATDTADNESAQSGSWRVTIDLSAPKTPTIDQIWDDAQRGIGAVPKKGTTNDTTPTLSDTAAPGTILKIFVNGEYVGETTIQATGQWNYTGFVNDGSHTFTVQSVNEVGTSSAMSDPFTIIVSTAMPGTPSTTEVIDDVGSITGTVGNGKPTDDTRPEIKGKANANAKVNIYDSGTIIGQATADADGNWSFKLPAALADGKYTFTAIAIDRAGNIGNASTGFAIEIDTTPPVAPMISRVQDTVPPKVGDINSGDATNDTRPSFSGTAEANGKVKVYLNGVEIGSADVNASGVWTFRPAADKALAEGTHNLTFKAMDKADNLSTTETTFKVVVDVTPPAKPVLDQIIDAVGAETGPISNNGTTDDSHPTFKGKGEAGGLVTIMDNGKVLGTTTVGADGTWTFRPDAAMTAEAHTITITVADAAGNVSAASDPWKITVVRPAGGEVNPDGDDMDAFSAGADAGDAHSFAARSVTDEPQAEEQHETETHAAPMSLDMSGVLAELDVQDGQDFDHSNYAANDYDDQSILAGLINLADASSDMSAQAEQSDDMPEELAGLDMTALANEVFEQPDQTEAEEIDLSALPEAPAEPVASSADVTPASEVPTVAGDVYTPPSTADLELERLLQQSAAQF